jgi:putative N6-adenine-specific DNA methylase
MIAAHMAPGMNREFISENWEQIVPKKAWYQAIDEANDLVDTDVETDIQGFDIDDEMVAVSRENAKLAGVEELIHFQQRPVAKLRHPKKYGFIITNPPYGERLEDKADLPPLYTALGESYRALDSWSMYVISAYEDAQKYIGRQADKNRKIYNGMMKTYYYMYNGPKPPKHGGMRDGKQKEQ